MDDISGLLECEEMHAVVAAIEALRRRYSQSSPSTEGMTFFQLISGRFPARDVLELLASQDAGYPGQKDVLAAAFSAWLLFPKERGIRKNWMVNAILYHMDQAEYAAGLANADWSLERDVISRYIFIDNRFLRDMYDNSGGYQAFMNTDSPETFYIIYEHGMRTIRTAARSMLYIHHLADSYKIGVINYKPSVNKSYKIFKEIRESESKSLRGTSGKNKTPQYTYVARSSLHKVWGENKGALALIYAASCLRATRVKSLLDVLLNGEFSHSMHGPLIPKWCGMARYVVDTIFTEMGDVGLMRSADRLLAGVAPVHFHRPKLNLEESNFFRKNFGVISDR